MRYIVLRSRYLNDLENEVNSKIAEGYIPLGGIGIANDPQYIEFFQAMTLVAHRTLD